MRTSFATVRAIRWLEEIGFVFSLNVVDEAAREMEI